MQTTVKIGNDQITVKENLLDKIISTFDPVRAQNRFRARVSMALAGGYNGASKSNRAFKSWKVSGGDADSDLLPDLPTLRERSRDLVRNNPLATGAINTAVTNVVGTGLVLHSRIDREYLNLSDEDADAWERNAEREFKLWAESVECDAARTLNFYSHQDLCFRSALENGDIFYLLPFIKRKGSSYGLKLKAIEADRVTNKDCARDSATLAGGIETDSNGAPVKVHILENHPGEKGKTTTSWNVVPMFGRKSGRRNILHLFEQRRVGQRRGAPYLSPVIESLKQLGRFTDAELMAAVVSGMFTVFVKSETGSGLGNADEAQTTNDTDYELGNGAIVGLGNNESIETANPGRPNAAFDPFVMAILRQIGSALEIPFELLVKHFTASYSASRAAFVEAWKFFKKRRKWLADYFCQPVYESFLYEAVASGRIVAPGFMEDERVRKAYLGSMWIGPGKGQIQELQEVKAARERIDSGLSTLAQETAEINGGDWDQNHRQSVKEHKARQDDGLIEQDSPPPIEQSNDEEAA